MKPLASTLALCALLALAGCGGSGGSSSSTGSTESAATGSTESAATGSTESASTGSTASGKEKTKPTVAVPKGKPPKKLVVKEIEAGTGATAKAGDQVTVQYVGVNYKTGREFDSSWSRDEPFAFNLGAGEVIPGWDEGVAGMKVGGRRELIIPPRLGYGEAGSPPAIPPNETLVFVVDLLSVE